MKHDEFIALAAPAAAVLGSRRAAFADLGGRMSRYFGELRQRLKGKRSLRVTLSDPPATADDREHLLVLSDRCSVSRDGSEQWQLTLIRVDPVDSPRRCKLVERMVVCYDRPLAQGDDSIRIGRASTDPARAEADARRIVANIDAFLADPIRAIARSGTHCVHCRKALTDDLSRARGIGPDCFEQRGDLSGLLWPIETEVAI